MSQYFALLGTDVEQAQGLACPGGWSQLRLEVNQGWSSYSCARALPHGIGSMIMIALDGRVIMVVGRGFSLTESEAAVRYTEMMRTFQTQAGCRPFTGRDYSRRAEFEQEFTCGGWTGGVGRSGTMVLWILGDRYLSDAWLADEERYADTSCGEEASAPAEVAASEWISWGCARRSDAADEWDQCLRRRAFTTDSGAGCPGEERCCPPGAIQRRAERLRYEASQRFVLGRFQYEIDDIETRTRIGRSHFRVEPSSGARFILVEYSMRNVSPETVTILTDNLVLRDFRGREFRPSSEAGMALSMGDRNRDLFASDMQPGVASERGVVFEVPQASTQYPVNLVFREHGFGNSGEHQVQLTVD